jgi:hypothetical protein
LDGLWWWPTPGASLGPRPPRLSLLQRRGRCKSKYFQHELLMGCSDQDSGLSGICPL